MKNFILGLLVLACLVFSVFRVIDHFAREVYANGCRDEAFQIVQMVYALSGDQEGATKFGETLFNECDERSRSVSLKDIL